MDLLNHEYQFVWAILISVLTSVIFSSLFFSFQLSRVKKNYSQYLHKIETNLNVITSGSLGMGQKMLDLEKRFSKLRDTQDEMKIKDLNFSYTTAEKLISQGVDDRAVAANSGLSSTEVNLMRLLHGNQGECQTDNISEESLAYAERQITEAMSRL